MGRDGENKAAPWAATAGAAARFHVLTSQQSFLGMIGRSRAAVRKVAHRRSSHGCWGACLRGLIPGVRVLGPPLQTQAGILHQSGPQKGGVCGRWERPSLRFHSSQPSKARSSARRAPFAYLKPAPRSPAHKLSNGVRYTQNGRRLAPQLPETCLRPTKNRAQSTTTARISGPAGRRIRVD